MDNIDGKSKAALAAAMAANQHPHYQHLHHLPEDQLIADPQTSDILNVFNRPQQQQQLHVNGSATKQQQQQQQQQQMASSQGSVQAMEIASGPSSIKSTTNEHYELPNLSPHHQTKCKSNVKDMKCT